MTRNVKCNQALTEYTVQIGKLRKTQQVDGKLIYDSSAVHKSSYNINYKYKRWMCVLQFMWMFEGVCSHPRGCLYKYISITWDEWRLKGQRVQGLDGYVLLKIEQLTRNLCFNQTLESLSVTAYCLSARLHLPLLLLLLLGLSPFFWPPPPPPPPCFIVIILLWCTCCRLEQYSHFCCCRLTRSLFRG